MSQQGRGSGPHDDHSDGEATEKERSSQRSLSASSAPPIAPYDPYRPMTGDRPRVPTRNVAADPFEPSFRSSRGGDDDPFLPGRRSSQRRRLAAPSLMKASLGEVDEAPLSEFDVDPSLPPRRARRQPPSMRSGREPAPGARRAARRGRSSTAGTRGRGARPASRSRCRGSSPDPHS